MTLKKLKDHRHFQAQEGLTEDQWKEKKRSRQQRLLYKIERNRQRQQNGVEEVELWDDDNDYQK